MKRQGLVVFEGDPPGDSFSVPMDLLLVGVVFFPSLPSMGVMLFPSFVLGDASREGGTLFVSLFPFSPLLPLSLLSSSCPSFSHSLFLLFLFFPISFSFPFAHSLPLFPSLSSPSPSFSISLSLFPFLSSPIFHLFFLSFRLSLPLFPSSFLSLEVFFFFEGTACIFHLRDVRNDTIVCNQLYLYWNKERFPFLSHEFAYSDVCNFLAHSLAELSKTSDKIINKHTIRHPKTDNTLFKITTEVY